MSTFTADVEFIQFLKSISMFVTDDKGTIGLDETDHGSTE